MSLILHIHMYFINLKNIWKFFTCFHKQVESQNFRDSPCSVPWFYRWNSKVQGYCMTFPRLLNQVEVWSVKHIDSHFTSEERLMRPAERLLPVSWIQSGATAWGTCAWYMRYSHCKNIFRILWYKIPCKHYLINPHHTVNKIKIILHGIEIKIYTWCLDSQMG